MPTLNELTSRLMSALAGPSLPEGYAQARRGNHPALFMLSPLQYAQVLRNVEAPPEGVNVGAVTRLPSPYNLLSAIGERLRGHATESNILSIAGREPVIFAPTNAPSKDLTHEITHTMTYRNIPEAFKQAYPGHLQEYPATARAYEMPPRFMTDPASLGLTQDEGRTAMLNYVRDNMSNNPEMARRLMKMYNLSITSPKGNTQRSNDTLTSFQRPNDTF